MAKTSRVSALLLATLAGCSNRPSENVVKVAEYYVERLADTSRTDSAAVSADTLLLEAATAGWTVSEWQEFWAEVDKRRRR